MEFANNRLTWKTSTIPFLVLLAATLTTDRCPGEIWHDSLAPMNWEAMKSCDLIFAGKYVSHKDKSLTLQVTEVLRGGAGVGQHVTVELEHHYSVEMGQVGWARIFETGTKPNRIAKLCYKQQITPDDPVPVPLLNDFRSGALYFIPDEVRPALTRLKQVQPLLFLEGWQQAIRDESMNLPFRLAQHVDRDVSRNALEELGVTRDAACLDQLFAWILDPALQGSFSPEAVLSRIGDRNGDVYDRAAKLVKQNAPGSNPYRFAALTGLMAVVHPARASEELQSLLVSDRPLIVRTAALLGMGRLQDRKTAVLTFDAMQDNELAEAAFTSIRSRLRPNEDYRFPKTHHFENTDWLLAQLRLSTTNEEVPDSIRRRIADYFGHELRDATQLDLDVLRTLLLDPGNRIHHGWADGETAELLRQTTEACDPRLVPILAEVLAAVPAASKRPGVFLETLRFYSRICPRAMQRELLQRDLIRRLKDAPRHEQSYLIRDVLAEVQREPNSEKVKSELSEIEQLARLVRQGDQEKAALLLQSVEQLIRQQEYLAPQALKLLLDSGIPDARKRYLARIAHAKQGAVNSFSHERFLDSTLTLLLHQLFPAYRPLYFEQVIALLESESLIEREAGVNSLTYTLRCDFSFDPASLRAERLRKLAIMEPMFDRLKDASETQTHALVLEHLGIVLEGPPGDGWLPRLSAAVFDRDPNVAGTALRLIEILCEAPQLRRLENLPPAHRGRAIKAFLIDAERIRA